MMTNPVGKLGAALAKARVAFPEIKKDCTVKIEARNGRNYSYSYASLATICEAVMPALAANGLSITQTFEQPADGKPEVVVVTTLIHESNERIESRLAMPLADRDPKTMGGAVTYGRRYALSAILCVAVEEDDDAGSGGQPKTHAPAPHRRSNDTPPPQDRQQCASTDAPRGEPASNKEAWDATKAHAAKPAATPPPVVKLRDQAPHTVGPIATPTNPTSLEPHQTKAADLILKYLADGGIAEAKRKDTAGEMLRAMLPHCKSTRDITPLDSERIRVCITLLPRVPGNSIGDVNQYLTQQIQVQPLHQMNEADVQYVFDQLAQGLSKPIDPLGDDDIPF